MEIRKTTVCHKGMLYVLAPHILSPPPDITFENEFSFDERYVVWPTNPKAKPKLRGRFCTFQTVSSRSGAPRATVVFEDDGKQATIDFSDLLTEEQMQQHKEHYASRRKPKQQLEKVV